MRGRCRATQASADRDNARFARLRVATARRKLERNGQAQRLLALHGLGQEVLEHAAKVPALADDTAADDKIIAEAQARKRERIESFNSDLIGLASSIVALGPHPLRPGGLAHPASARVHAAVVNGDPGARETCHVTVGGTRVSGIWLNDPDGEAHAIGAAVRQIAQRDPGERLVRALTAWWCRWVTIRSAILRGVWSGASCTCSPRMRSRRIMRVRGHDRGLDAGESE